MPSKSSRSSIKPATNPTTKPTSQPVSVNEKEDFDAIAIQGEDRIYMVAPKDIYCVWVEENLKYQYQRPNVSDAR